MLKIYRGEKEYTAKELAELYPGFHFTAELIKCLEYDSEKDVFTVKSELPSYELIMNRMAELYSVSSSDFKDFLLKKLEYIENQLIFFKNRKKGSEKKNIEKIRKLKTMIKKIDFPVITSDLVIEPIEMVFKGPEAILGNLFYAVKLIQEYYEDSFTNNCSVVIQLSDIIEEIINFDLKE